MNIETINFNSQKTRSSGRNKEVVTTGLVIFEDEDKNIKINPLTSHGEITMSCYLTLPRGDINNLIKGLEKLL